MNRVVELCFNDYKENGGVNHEISDLNYKLLQLINHINDNGLKDDIKSTLETLQDKMEEDAFEQGYAYGADSKKVTKRRMKSNDTKAINALTIQEAVKDFADNYKTYICVRTTKEVYAKFIQLYGLNIGSNRLAMELSKLGYTTKQKMFGRIRNQYYIKK